MTTSDKLDRTSNPNPFPAPPPTEVKTLRDAVKIFLVVFAWCLLRGLLNALAGAVDFSHLDHFGTFPHVNPAFWSILAWGAAFGGLQGIILGQMSVLFLWAGPTFFGALAPVIQSVANITSGIIATFRRAWTRQGDEGNPKSGNQAGGGGANQGSSDAGVGKPA